MPQPPSFNHSLKAAAARVDEMHHEVTRIAVEPVDAPFLKQRLRLAQTATALAQAEFALQKAVEDIATTEANHFEAIADLNLAIRYSGINAPEF